MQFSKESESVLRAFVVGESTGPAHRFFPFL